MPATTSPRGTRRGSPQLRLRVGFVVIAMLLSVFGARLVQLQGLDPNSYAQMAAADGQRNVVLPATRGDILDRNGEPVRRLRRRHDGGRRPAADRAEGRRDRGVPLPQARRRLPLDAGQAPRARGRRHGGALRVRRAPGAVHHRHGGHRGGDGPQVQGPRHPPRPGARLPGRRRGGQPGRLHRHRRAAGRLRAHLRQAALRHRRLRPLRGRRRQPAPARREHRHRRRSTART